MTARKRAGHVVEERWQVGGFHVIRHLRCRCGWTAEHYHAGTLTEMFQEHKAEQSDDSRTGEQ